LPVLCTAGILCPLNTHRKEHHEWGTSFCIQWKKEQKMPQSTHDRVAELHNLAAHAHQRAAVSHRQEDHLSAHELSKQAFEHSREAHEHSEKMMDELAKTAK